MLLSLLCLILRTRSAILKNKGIANILSVLAIIAVLASQFLKLDALATAASPEKDFTVVAGRTFTVEWTKFGNNTRFEIDLYRESETQSHKNGCGTFVTMLCKHGE